MVLIDKNTVKGYNVNEAVGSGPICLLAGTGALTEGTGYMRTPVDENPLGFSNSFPRSSGESFLIGI